MIGVMKMINENKLIEDLNTMIEDSPISYMEDENHDRLNAYNYALSRVISIIKNQHKEYEWIPVTESFPDKAGTYLVTYHPRYGDNVNENVVAIDVDNFGRGLWGNRKRQRVIAWMLLPGPYKGSAENEAKNQM